MALELETIQPVRIDGKKCTPKVDPEQKLRLSQVRTETKDDRERSYDIIAGCFPDDKEYVLSKLPGLSELDISMLVTYLAQGETGVKTAAEAIIRQVRVDKK